jgi:hypothetical protein
MNFRNRDFEHKMSFLGNRVRDVNFG